MAVGPPLETPAREDLAAGGPQPGDTDLIGYHPEVARIRAQVHRLAATVWPVLLVGERGTGKGQLMRAIARSRDKVPLVVALATISESVAESELFGHTKGASVRTR